MVINFSNALIGVQCLDGNYNVASGIANSLQSLTMTVYDDNYNSVGTISRSGNFITTTHDGVCETMVTFGIAGNGLTAAGNILRMAGASASSSHIYIKVPYNVGDTGSFSIKITIPAP